MCEDHTYGFDVETEDLYGFDGELELRVRTLFSGVPQWITSALSLRKPYVSQYVTNHSYIRH